MLSSDQKGAIAETAIAHAALKLGIDVYRPIGEGGRYDLIFDIGNRLLRVQCKWAGQRGDVIAVRCYSSRRTAEGFRRRSYEADEIDAIAAYCPDLDRSFFIPLDDVFRKAYVQLRLGPTRNKQRCGVNWADDFALDARLIGLVGP